MFLTKSNKQWLSHGGDGDHVGAVLDDKWWWWWSWWWSWWSSSWWWKCQYPPSVAVSPDTAVTCFGCSRNWEEENWTSSKSNISMSEIYIVLILQITKFHDMDIRSYSTANGIINCKIWNWSTFNGIIKRDINIPLIRGSTVSQFVLRSYLNGRHNIPSREVQQLKAFFHVWRLRFWTG